MHYVMSDVHGDMDKFQKMLRLIKFHPWDRLLIIGDVIDRGEKGVEILKYIMRKKNIMLLKGNHERDMCRAICQDQSELTDEVWDLFGLWFDNGGEVTYRALLEEPKQTARQIVNFANDLKSHMMISVHGKDYLLVHAGVFWNPNLSFEKNMTLNEKTEFIYDIREGFLDRTPTLPFTVISGHTPVQFLHEHMSDLTEDEKERCEAHHMIIRKDKILIDCGCGIGCSLGCLRLDDMKEFYI